jgi:plastocyanin
MTTRSCSNAESLGETRHPCQMSDTSPERRTHGRSNRQANRVWPLDRALVAATAVAGAVSAAVLVASCGSNKTSIGAAATKPTVSASTALPTTTTLAASTAVGAPKGAGAIEVGMANFSFIPETITAKAGDVVFFLENKDPAGDPNLHHNMLITLAVNGLPTLVASSGDFQQGQSGTFSVKNLAPGTYAFFCSYHRSAGMTGSLTVAP